MPHTTGILHHCPLDSGRKGNCRHAKKSTPGKGRIRYCSKHQGVCEVHHWVWTKAIDLGCVSCLAKAAATKKKEEKDNASDGDDEPSEPEAAEGGDEAEAGEAAVPTEKEQASDGHDADAEPEVADPVVAVAPVWRDKRKRSLPRRGPREGGEEEAEQEVEEVKDRPS